MWKAVILVVTVTADIKLEMFVEGSRWVMDKMIW